jgi:hypothetical protein
MRWANDGPQKAEAVFRDKPPKPKLRQDSWYNACDWTGSLVKAQSCGRISYDEAIHGMREDPEGGLDTSTNSGLPWVIGPWKMGSDPRGPRDEEVVLAYQWIMSEVKRLESLLSRPHVITDLPVWDCIVGQRLVQKGPEPFHPKSKRLVEAYPKPEAVVARTLTEQPMEALRGVYSNCGNRILCAWMNLRFIDGNMQLLLDYANKHELIVMSGDVSNFDATVPPWALWDVGQRVATWIKGAETLTRNLIAMMIFRSRLVTPTKIYGPGASSMKSGSGFTNMLGSLTNLTIIKYGEVIGLYKIEGVSVLGDDFVMVGDGVTPETVAECFSHFGMDANPDKQYYRHGALQYLKRLHVLGQPGGIASVYRTLGSVLSLEKLAVRPKEWNSKAYVVQALSRLENANFNPYFSVLVNFVKDGDKLRLGEGMTPEELVSASGKAGERILKEDARHTWKQLGSGTSFANWSANGVVRGEVLPENELDLFRRIYGDNPAI